MRILDLILGRPKEVVTAQPRNDAGPVVATYDLTDPAIAGFLRGGSMSAAGEAITPHSALNVASAYRCVTLIDGAVASLPMDIKTRVNATTRKDAENHYLWPLLKRRPNPWQTPQEFKKLQQMYVLLRGNAYALIVRSMGEVKALIPLTRSMDVKQNDDFSLSYAYTSKSGAKIPLKQSDVFHLRGPSFDGITGLSVLSYARESLGLSITMGRHAGRLFKNRAAISGKITADGGLNEVQRTQIKESLANFRGVDGDESHKDLILENGMDYEPIGMTSVDSQFIQTLQMSAYDVCMFFGVPPHMVGLTSKTTSWGSGIEQMGIGFVAYTLQDHLTMWGETIARDLIAPDDTKTYINIDPAGLLKGDIKTRVWSYAMGRQWGWWSANDVRAKEDENPIDDGDIYLMPTNMMDVQDPPPDEPAVAVEPDDQSDEPPAKPAKKKAPAKKPAKK